MDPVTQDAAAQAMRDGLTRFDGGRGWSDLGLKVDLAKDWAARLDATPVGTGYPDWRKAVVLNKGDAQANIGFANGTTGVLNAGDAAMAKRGVGGRAFDFLEPGMVIIVKQIGGSNYALRSIPEVSGGMLVEEVHTGRVMAMQGGFDVVGSSYNRAIQALRQPGSAFKPIVYVTALQNGFTPATIELDAPFCVWQGAGLGQKCFVNFDRRSAGPHTLRWGVEQSRNLMTVRAASTIGMPKITATARTLGRRRLWQLPLIRSRRGRYHRPAADQRLCDPRQPGPVGEAEHHRLRPGPQRQGHLPHRQSLRGHGQL